MTDDTKLYFPRRAKMWRAAVFFILGGVIVGPPQLGRYSLAMHGGDWPPLNSAILLALAFVSLAFGILAMASAVLRLPRLQVTPRSVMLKSVLGSRWAAWNSLSAFTLDTTRLGRSKQAAMFATAEIVGPAASSCLLRKKQFTIPNAFVRPLLDIVGDLNAMNPRAMAAPWTSQERVQHLGLAGFRVRWMTFGILVVLIAVFFAELQFAVGPIRPGLHPSLSTLLALGGLNRGVVLANGEWYRLLTAPLLHLDATHLILNCIALLMAGFALEQLVGRAWLLALFVLGALGGSLASLAMNPPILTSVGASGAIMCMFAAVYVCSFRLPAGRDRMRMQVRSLYMVIPALIPLAATAATRQIDYAAHFGGALTGVVVGLLLLRKWPPAARIPEMRVLASSIAAIGICLFMASSAAVAGHYAGYKVLAAKGVDSMIPHDRLPKTKLEIESQAADLLARYQNDPRSHMYQAIVLETRHAYPAAERELRTSLQLAKDLSPFITLQFSNTARAMLAHVQLEEGEKAQARATASSVCHVKPAEQPFAPLPKMLVDVHLCD